MEARERKKQEDVVPCTVRPTRFDLTTGSEAGHRTNVGDAMNISKNSSVMASVFK